MWHIHTTVNSSSTFMQKWIILHSFSKITNIAVISILSDCYKYIFKGDIMDVSNFFFRKPPAKID